MEINAHAHSLPDQISIDIAVIGSGPGGAVSASLLAETGKSVLLIEEGSNFPIQSATSFSRDEILQKYRNAGINVAFGDTKIAYVEGRCVGGGSEINRGLYHRTPDSILAKWRAEFQVDDLSSEGLLPHFLACEAVSHVEYLPEGASAMSIRLAQGASSLGWSAIEAPRLYRYGSGTGDGHKQSMSETFIPKFLSSGGRLIADTRVDLLTRSAGRWRIKARSARGNGVPQQIEISASSVFVACGAVQTPSLLRRSGLTRNIGNSLRFHPMVKVVAEFAEDVNSPTDADPVHQIKEFEPKIGIGCSISTRPMLTLVMVNHPEYLGYVTANWRRMGIYYVQTTGGLSHVRNIPFFRDPLVRTRGNVEELLRLAKGLKLLAEALFAAGATAVYPGIPGYPVLRSMTDVRALPDTLKNADGSLTSVHLFSSCPMGENKDVCATDSFGRVRDVDGLYIADASLLCTPTGVNPQGTVMAICHRNATFAIDNHFR